MKSCNFYRIFVPFCLIFVFSVLVAAQGTSRSGVIKTTDENGKIVETALYEGSFALVIGESDYTAGWNKLPGVKSDVAEIKRVLESKDFKVETELDLSSDALKNRIDKFIGDYGFAKNNRLLIYFAGHGHTQKSLDGRDLGYIVPVDAPKPEADETNFKRKAISMDTVQNYARQIEAKHALFVFDSCFSGTLISRGDVKTPPVITENVSFPVRQFITAGAATQTVPDDSIFRRVFTRGLEGEADLNSDGYITTSELAAFLIEKVTNVSERTQTPQYGKIRDLALERGDLVFILPESARITVKNQPAEKTKADTTRGSNKRARELAEQSLEEMKKANFRRAGELAADALVLDEDLPLALAVVGWSRQNQDAAKDALPFLERAIRLEPQNALFHARLIYAYDATGNETSARKSAEAVLKISANPKTALDFYSRALANEYVEKPEDALKDYTEAVKLDSKFALAYGNRASIYGEHKKDYEAAIKDFTKFIEINPNDAPAYNSRATAYTLTGKPDAAIDDFTRAIELAPKLADAYIGRGLLYAGEKKEYYKAIADFTRAIELMPDDDLAYGARADTFDKIGDKKAAEEDRKKSAELTKKP